MTVMAPPGMDFMTDAVAHWAAVRPDAEALTYSGALRTAGRGGRGHSGTTGSGGSRAVWPRSASGAATGWRSWTRTTRPAWR